MPNIKDKKMTTNMIESIYNNIFLNLDKMYLILKDKISTDELDNIKDEFTKVFNKTKINGDKEGNKLKSLDISDTLELFDNINIFLNSALKGKENKIRDLIIEEFTASDNKDIKTLISIFDKTSTFDKHIGENKDNSDNVLNYSTNGTAGQPDTAIVNFIDGKWVIDFSAASNTPSSLYESFQLYLHPINLQKALDLSLSQLTEENIEHKNINIQDISNRIKENYEKVKLIIGTTKKDKEKGINAFFNYIYNLENKDIDTMTKNININGTYSNPVLTFLKNNVTNSIVQPLIKTGVYTEDNFSSKIEHTSQWMFILSQLSNIFPLIQTQTSLNKDMNKDILEDKFIKVISNIMGNITFNSKKDSISKFQPSLNTEEGVLELLTIITDYTQLDLLDDEDEYYSIKVLGNKDILENFDSVTSFIQIKYKDNKKIMARLLEVNKTIERTSLDLINRRLTVAKYNLENDLKDKGYEIDTLLNIISRNNPTEYFRLLDNFENSSLIIEQYMEDNIEEIEELKKYIEMNDFLSEGKEYTSRELLKAQEEKINSLEQENYNFKQGYLDRINDALLEPETFIKEFYILANKYKIDSEIFLKTMEYIGELPESIEETQRKDIENIIFIFKNLEEILQVKITGKLEKEFFNEILMNSFENETISYNNFIENLSNKLVEIHPQGVSTILKNKELNKNITTLKANLSEKELLKIIIKKSAEEVKNLKNDTSPNKPGGPKKS